MKIIRFNAVWCPGCLIMKSRWKHILSVYPDLNIVNYDYDIDEEKVLEYGVGKTLPVVIFFDDNNIEIKRIIGEVDKNKLLDEIKILRGSDL